ncbi:IspD/TarI family cytidylyltransferase [Lentisphaera profundi]|uniref:IspD/TarI family cytidylyltransferase n=1 Tax=Lentisphaera profundi TaxID=1658616 RepID=A0ABY7VQ25_9BACT|nr:IspD/TarI family cytidylyltransferase [Lentisphaera profundi]WDE96273.1 IspD/TarI family cytidylyltransferase [Lentisphaera profundi]
MEKAAVLLCGGSGSRFGSNKLLVKLDGKEVFLHSLEALAQVIDSKNIVLVSSEKDKSQFKELLKVNGFSDVQVCCGGKERYHSVLKGLNKCSEKALVAIHDAARPFISSKLIEDTFSSAYKHGGAILCKKVSDTIKINDSEGVRTLQRDHLTAAETPQIFYCKDLKKAINFVIDNNLSVTDDAHAMECINKDYFMHIHEGNNKKITYTSDLD